MFVKTICQIAILYLLSNTLFSCTKNNDKDIAPTINTIIINGNLYESASNDEFDMGNISIDGDSIFISVSYGGGCEEVEFKLVDQGVIMESYPVQRNMRLSLKDEDYCKAIVSEQLSFDISPIQVDGNNKVIINLQGWNEQILYEY